MSMPNKIDTVQHSRVLVANRAELAVCAVADATYQPRGSERNVAGSDTGTMHGGSNSAALKSPIIVGSLRDHGVEDHAAGPLDAAAGMKNGLLYGLAFWVLAYLLFSLVNIFT